MGKMDAVILPVSDCDSNASVRVASNPFWARAPSTNGDHIRSILQRGAAAMHHMPQLVTAPELDVSSIAIGQAKAACEMTGESAKLSVLMSGGFSGAYERLLPEFERSTGIGVTTGSGASQGTGPQTIAAQLARGVHADVVILSREGLGDLIAANKIVAGTDVDLAQVPLGVAVRAGTAKPDVRTVEAFKQLLLKADIIAMPASTSGIWLEADLFPRLGIAGKVKTRLAPRGSDATRMVAAGEVDLAVMPVSEILAATGVAFAGAIAPEIQFVQTFSVAVVAGSKAIESSKRLIGFLSSALAVRAIRDSGMEPIAGAR